MDMAEEQLVRKELIKKAAEVLKMDSAKIDPDTPLVTYGMDSLTFFNLSFELEEKYGINFIDEQVTMDTTINQLVNVISKRKATAKRA